MSSPISRCKFYFHTDTFIEIILELELYPEADLLHRADSFADDITGADIDRWQKLFGLTADDARYFIAESRDVEEETQYSDETLRKWP